MNADMTLPGQQQHTQDIACAPEDRRRLAIGYTLVAIGLVIFLNNLGAFALVEWRYVGPVALMAIGAILLAHRTRR